MAKRPDSPLVIGVKKKLCTVKSRVHKAVESESDWITTDTSSDLSRLLPSDEPTTATQPRKQVGVSHSAGSRLSRRRRHNTLALIKRNCLTNHPPGNNNSNDSPQLSPEILRRCSRQTVTEEIVLPQVQLPADLDSDVVQEKVKRSLLLPSVNNLVCSSDQSSEHLDKKKTFKASSTFIEDHRHQDFTCKISRVDAPRPLTSSSDFDPVLCSTPLDQSSNIFTQGGDWCKVSGKTLPSGVNQVSGPTTNSTELKKPASDKCSKSNMARNSKKLDDSDVIVITEDDSSQPNTDTEKREATYLCRFPENSCSNCIRVTTDDYKTLEEGEFVNDIIIDFYLTYLHKETLRKEDREKVYVFSTQFFQRITSTTPHAFEKDDSLTLAEKRYKRVERWTKSLDLFQKDMIIFPICLDSHWFLIIAVKPGLIKKPDNPEERQTKGTPFLILLDSMGGVKERAVTIIRQYLAHEWRAKRDDEETFSSRDMRLFRPEKPLQENSTDCGIYLLHYVEKIFSSVAQFFWIKLPDLTNWFESTEIMRKRFELARHIQNLARTQEGIETFPEIRLFNGEEERGVRRSNRQRTCTRYQKDELILHDVPVQTSDRPRRYGKTYSKRTPIVPAPVYAYSSDEALLGTEEPRLAAYKIPKRSRRKSGDLEREDVIVPEDSSVHVGVDTATFYGKSNRLSRKRHHKRLPASDDRARTEVPSVVDPELNSRSDDQQAVSSTRVASSPPSTSALSEMPTCQESQRNGSKKLLYLKSKSDEGANTETASVRVNDTNLKDGNKSCSVINLRSGTDEEPQMPAQLLTVIDTDSDQDEPPHEAEPCGFGASSSTNGRSPASSCRHQQNTCDKPDVVVDSEDVIVDDDEVVLSREVPGSKAATTRRHARSPNTFYTEKSDKATRRRDASVELLAKNQPRAPKIIIDSAVDGVVEEPEAGVDGWPTLPSRVTAATSNKATGRNGGRHNQLSPQRKARVQGQIVKNKINRLSPKKYDASKYRVYSLSSNNTSCGTTDLESSEEIKPNKFFKSKAKTTNSSVVPKDLNKKKFQLISKKTRAVQKARLTESERRQQWCEILQDQDLAADEDGVFD